MLKYDVRGFSDDQREKLARKVQRLSDFDLPTLSHWNYQRCPDHFDGWAEVYYEPGSDEARTRIVTDRPKPGCRKCGIIPRKHQRVGITWLYLKKRGLLADTMGSGKTIHAAGLVAMLLETGEIPTLGRAVIIPRSPALGQWYDQLLRMIPGLNVIVATGTRRQRVASYLQPWDVLLIGPQMLVNDFDMVSRFPLALVVSDDVDELRDAGRETSNKKGVTSTTLDLLGARADRYVIMSGTPLQKRLMELHSVLDGVGGVSALGPREFVEQRYIRREFVKDFNSKTGQEFKRQKVVGYKNLDEFKRRISPLVMRRTQFEDVDMPTIIPDDVMLDLYPAQRRKYDELRSGVIRLMREEGPKVKRVTALSRLHYGAAICAGLAALGEPDGPQTSMKMDWILRQITEGDLSDEKVVVFANLKPTIRALQARFDQAGIGHVTVWGEDKNREHRDAARRQFWDDKKTRVLIGTKSIEQSLDLQVSRHLVNVDTILNQARMEQLAGRIRRDGSAFTHVFVHNLLTVGTQEEGYTPMLEREAALAGFIWDENSQLFNALPPLALLQLIAG